MSDTFYQIFFLASALIPFPYLLMATGWGRRNRDGLAWFGNLMGMIALAMLGTMFITTHAPVGVSLFGIPLWQMWGIVAYLGVVPAFFTMVRKFFVMIA